MGAMGDRNSPGRRTSPAPSPPSAAPKSQSPAASPPAEEAETSTAPAGILPAEYWIQQGLEESHNDNDSTFEDTVSSTASLSESILQYRTLHGRTYHSDKVTDNQYWTPNDEKQKESMDIIHHMIMLVLDGRLFRAPLRDDIQKVIDVGTGTGMWAIDFADQFPTADVTGTDISPIQPSWVPPNLRFEIDDATKEWTYPANTFDFIHSRYMFGSIGDWAGFYREAYRCCKPGGWVESFEPSAVMESDDGSLYERSPMDQWGKVFVEAGRKLGRPFDVPQQDLQRKGMEEAGFVNVDIWDFKCPLSGWPKDRKLNEIGMYSQLAIEQDIEGYVLFMWGQVMGWSSEQIGVYIAHFRRQLRDYNVHAYVRMRSVFAQKPYTDAR
ncbi:S-adenosyl-L-methionine-dependent methyltransferase [Bombardia bombarda]|uniref:S-adenosyl-L-methionine-dependent methyltransferase n=1 Tax=Bombardia bombarda TaxID=252184 RepID=A0AA39T0T2_9PEZI|nr:S-adenosyl-L-methionine-dependent methyltransferase [Bombardia bombarda]